MGYYIDWENSGGASAVPKTALDPLKNCRPKDAKWLLYTVLSGDFGLESSAEGLSMDISDTEEALQFWLNRGVIKSGDKACSKTVKTTVTADEKDVRHNFLRPFDKKEVTEIIENSGALQYLFKEIEALIPGAPTLTEQKTYILIHEYYGIEVSNILMAVHFAVKIGKYPNRSPAYVETIAKYWHENRILSHKDATDDIKRRREYFTFEGRIKTIFGLGRPFTAKEREHIEVWQSYGYYDDIFKYAYEVSVEHTGVIKLPYIAKVLTNWYMTGLRNLDEIKEYNEKYLEKQGEYKSLKKPFMKAPKNKGTPSFDLTNAENEDFEAALRGEFG
ncbi:MAG: DnaD domain protein [Ruminococcus sp.]|jgi:hypothetical protein|nr:DnaD domain protein [Ruminococcus sp.]